MGYFLAAASRSALGPFLRPIQMIAGTVSAELKQTEPKTYFAHQSDLEVNNTRSYTFTPHGSVWDGALLNTGRHLGFV